jgi:hypothetical protein
MSPEPTTEFSPDDELVHAHDPNVWSWNESFLLSWLDPDGGPAGLFRLGILPNQGRGWLWFFLHDEHEWLTVEETRLDLRHFDLTDGATYDAWGLRFGWTPTDPLHRAVFHLDGVTRVRSGPRSGALVPVSIELAASATTPCFGTGTGHEPDERPQFPASRFEQSVALTGTLTVDGHTRPISCPGHRDRSWGPRTWQVAFALGDLQGRDLQLYFAGSPQPAERGSGYLRDGHGMRLISRIDGTIAYDDEHRTIAPSRLVFSDDTSTSIALDLEPASPSISFDMAHSTEPPEHWTYWRLLVNARVDDSDVVLRGWFEANRYGIARTT